MSLELARSGVKNSNNGSLILGASLAVASMILVPALAMRLGLGPSLTGALRIALMKASSRAASGTPASDNPGSAEKNCG